MVQAGVVRYFKEKSEDIIVYYYYCTVLYCIDPCGEDGRWGAVAQGGIAGSGKIHDLLAQGRRGGQPTTCDQTRLS